jgi:cell wall-associated NlpC family hydrolase
VGLGLPGGPAGASPTDSTPSSGDIAQAQSQVNSLESSIAQQQRQSAALSQQYDAAEQELQQAQAKLQQTTADLVRIRKQLAIDKERLKQDAINAYVYATPQTNFTALFTSPADRADARAEYQATVVGDLAAATKAEQATQAQLVASEAQLQTEEQQASSSAAQAQTLQAQNTAAMAAAQATLQQAQGTLAQEVAAAAVARAQQEAAAAAAAKTAAQRSAAATAAQSAVAVASAVGGPSAGAAAVQAANQATSSGSTQGTSSPTQASSSAPTSGSSSSGSAGPSVSGTGSGGNSTAVQAAVSQIGVPYVWGSESPGKGFDCSGLTQWAWAQAGVSIPRGAAAQYLGVEHVSLQSLEPGDLLFYWNLDDDNQVDHVVMYVGSGPYGTQTIVAAPFTGATVTYEPLFTAGLIAAGRP